METLIYIGKVNLYWILLFACYRLMLRQHTFFQWNRFYLLGSLIIAFALPFVIYPETAPAIPVIYEVSSATITISDAPVEKPLFTWKDGLAAVYGLGLLVAAFIFMKHIFQLRKFLLSGEVIELEDCTVVMIDSNHIGSFSFLKWIVINRNDYESHFDEILCHEMVHTRQFHSLDILFVELLRVIFWFNPILLLYKKDLQEVHEFLADSKASNRESYARFLVSYALNAPVAALTNHFFKPSQLKSRIQMIYKNRTSKWLLTSYLAAATLIGATALFVAGCEQKEDQQPEQEAKLTSGKVFTVVEKQPEYPGGNEAMIQFLADNIKYPKQAVDDNIEGRVFLQFVVNTKGETQDITILKGIGHGCDEEAIRVLKKFPRWVPGEQSGEKVNVKYNLPINFALDENNDQARKAAKKEPLFIVDGQPTSKAKMDANVPNENIASVNVLKGEKATSVYGDRGKNGVVEVTTKNLSLAAVDQRPATLNISEFTATSLEPLAKANNSASKTKPGVTVTGKRFSSGNPLVIIDGEKQEIRGKASLSTIAPENIQAISVLRDASATAAYGDEGADGVIIVTTKKK